ncbi:hypothetical protein WJX73_004994 [Symbiochloris irregularis]|uniref:sn-1-specific diacylglycerol lipase n=1 Tax=Symbiochloris irregularis TaxID=706552 RepID=A0AAW1P398_9CHLO
MPALTLLGRRWNVATDDFGLLGVAPTAFHGAWSIILFSCWLSLDRDSPCTLTISYRLAVAGLGSTGAVNFFLGIWLVCESLRGTIFETDKRWKVPYLLYAFFLVLCVELGFLIYGTVVLAQHQPDCDVRTTALWSPSGVMSVLIWSTWGIMGFALIFALITYNAFPDHSSRSSWEHRCYCVTAVCCCQWRRGWFKPREQQEQEPYARLAELFLQLFGHSDLVFTDILAAFLMVAEWQREQRQHTINALLEDGDSDLEEPCESSNGHQTQPRQLRGADSATSGEPLCNQDSYGYMLFIWSKPRQGCMNLCCGRWCGLWTGPLKRYAEAFAAQRIIPDLAITNHMNHEAILQMSGLKERDLAFVRFQGEANDQHCLPYFLALDHETKSIVLAIRGTLSLDDCLTDFMCEPADLEEWIVSAQPGGLRELGRQSKDARPGRLRLPLLSGFNLDRRKLAKSRTQAEDDAGSHAHNPPANFSEDAPAVQLATRDAKSTAHAGMLDAAKAIVDDLRHTGVFESLLTGKQIGRHKLRHDCQGWGVVVTGHSLGAGAGVLVALYLNNYFQNVRCWAFEPPGGVADPYIAEAVRGWCTSCVLGKDWIPRLTLATFERLRDEMITAAATCRRNKISFLAGALLGRKHRQKMRSQGRSLFRSEDDISPQARVMLQTWRHSVLGTRSQENRYHQARSFMPPGRLLFLQPLKAGTSVRRSKRQYQPVWIEAEALMREGILVSPRMMADHMPDYLTAVLRRMTKQRGNPTGGEVELDMEAADQGDTEELDR